MSRPQFSIVIPLVFESGTSDRLCSNFRIMPHSRLSVKASLGKFRHFVSISRDISKVLVLFRQGPDSSAKYAPVPLAGFDGLPGVI